ncbi:hypothetical protein HYT92_03415 [Candidatus Pacearchaeota archaeon]|nr:hypothetical protein [Candidatus Pacearchaeota archaeon]
MHREIFNEVGLTNSEARIYTALLDLGTAQIGQIVERTGMHRRNIYDSISRLLEKGLASFVISNSKKVFSPASPRRMIGLLEEKKFELENLKARLNKIMPELEIKTRLEERHDVRFFKGPEGLKTVFEHILRTGEDYVGISPGYHLEKLLKYYMRHFANKRVNSKIRKKLIYSEKARKQTKKNALTEIRYIPDRYSSITALRVYGNNVAILLLSEKDPVAVVVRNHAIADGYRKYFELMWKAAKP